MSCKVPMVSCMQWVWFHTYIGCDVISQLGFITQIRWVSCQIQSCVVIHPAGEMSYTLRIMSKTLQVSCHIRFHFFFPSIVISDGTRCHDLSFLNVEF